MTSQQDKLNKFEKLISELSCTICNETLDDPHALLCGHTYCGHCILTWLNQKKVCPHCRVSVVRQPVHVNALQKLVDILKPEGSILGRRLQRMDWLELFPVDNNVTYIRDEDQDGVILRCSQCGWELDEEHFCATCGIQYETEGTSRANATEISDTESHHEFEEDLSDFVVDDNEVAYSPDNSEDEILRNIDRRTEETHSPLIGRDPSNAIEIDDDNNDSEPSVSFSRRRRPQISSDEGESDVNSDEDSNAEKSVTQGTDTEESDEEDIEEIMYEDEEEEEVHRPAFLSKYFDDYAKEDSEEEERPAVRSTTDRIMENITRAKDKMKQSVVEIESSESSDTSDTDSDAPDYESMFINNPKIDENVIPKTTEKPETSTSQVTENKSPSKKSKKRKNRNKNKKNKKKAKVN